MEAGICFNYLGPKLSAIVESYVDLGGITYKVAVGQDVASRVDDHPGTHAVDTFCSVGGILITPHNFLAVNIDDRRTRSLYGSDDRRSAQVGGMAVHR